MMKKRGNKKERCVSFEGHLIIITTLFISLFLMFLCGLFNTMDHSESPPPRLYLLHPPPPLQSPPPQARPPAPLLPLGVQKQSNDKSDKMQIKWIQQIFTHPTELTLLCLLPGQRGNRNTSQLMHSHCHEQSTTPTDEWRWMLLYSLVFLFYV